MNQKSIFYYYCIHKIPYFFHFKTISVPTAQSKLENRFSVALQTIPISNQNHTLNVNCINNILKHTDAKQKFFEYQVLLYIMHIEL